MYKQTQKWLALTIAVVLLLSLFTGCGASSADSAAYEAAPAAEAPGAKKKSPSSYSGMVALTAYFFDL
jgi:hypothetical protein